MDLNKYLVNNGVSYGLFHKAFESAILELISFIYFAALTVYN